MPDLDAIAESIRVDFVARNAARDAAIAGSRELIRYCAEAIRAVHRREWGAAEQKLAVVDTAAAALKAGVAAYPDLYHSGYTQDALKEVVEAHATYAIVRGMELPTPDSLQVQGSTYLNGLAEAATELRRFILDILRREEAATETGAPTAVAEAERLLNWMDTIYDRLVTFDFPDAITGDLRRRTDAVRGVLERTRGDLTTTIQQHRLQMALRQVEAKL
ncbi:MAG: haloacid dehalogenase [Anaerolineae bacterium]|nr:haloacid dehalogenase [Anaerolineae bacterium]